MSWQTQEMLRELMPIAGVLLFVGVILWWIFPYLPDEPERGWGPKKKR